MKKPQKAKSSKLSIPHMKKYDSIIFTRSLVKSHTNETLKQMGINPTIKK